MNENPTVPKPKISGDRLSKDGKWRSFPKVPGLMQYVSTGTYFARVRVQGKLFRQSLETTVFTTAKEKLPDFAKEHRTKQFPEGTFGEALAKYEWNIQNDPALSPYTKKYRKACVAKLLSSWPGLRETKLKDIDERECKTEFATLRDAIDAQYFNNILGTFRAVLKKAGVLAKDDPSQGDEPIKRKGVIIEQEELPESTLNTLVEHLQKSSAWRHHEAARLIRFAALSGGRISEVSRVTWGDIDLNGGFIKVHGAKKRGWQNHSPTRKVPIIPPMRELLEELKRTAGENVSASERVLRFKECYTTLKKACEDLKIPRLTHHSFRGWFATRAMEKGIDVATVAEWCGHKDGGALLLKRYRKASEEHSLKMAEKFQLGVGK